MYGTSTKSSLMMVPCGRCGANNFVPATLQKFQTIPCTECRSGVMAPVHMDHFELRSRECADNAHFFNLFGRLDFDGHRLLQVSPEVWWNSIRSAVQPELVASLGSVVAFGLRV